MVLLAMIGSVSDSRPPPGRLVSIRALSCRRASKRARRVESISYHTDMVMVMVSSIYSRVSSTARLYSGKPHNKFFFPCVSVQLTLSQQRSIRLLTLAKS